MFQANQTYQQFVDITGGEASWLADKGWLFGLVMAAMVGRGDHRRHQARSPASPTSSCRPWRSSTSRRALVIIVAHLGQVPAAFGAIIAGAFTAEGVAGGVVGALIQRLPAGHLLERGRRRLGVDRALGGAHARHPVTEGFVALLEPFIDTVVICTMTALVVIITGTLPASRASTGSQITNARLRQRLPWFPYVLTLAVLLFAFSTQISWSYYGLKAWTYLFGEGKAKELVYKAIFCVFVVVGASLQLGAIIDFSDALFFAMALINIIGLYILAPVVKRDLESYWSRLQAGQLTRYRTSWLIHVD